MSMFAPIYRSQLFTRYKFVFYIRMLTGCTFLNKTKNKGPSDTFSAFTFSSGVTAVTRVTCHVVALA